MTKTEIETAFAAFKKSYRVRSAWDKGICEYCDELLENLADGEEYNKKLLRKAFLNGASDWNQYSWGGCSLIYDADIAERLCTASQLKRYDNGRKEPNKLEQWLDVQARALKCAEELLLSLVH